MNRKERRAAAKRGKALATPAPAAGRPETPSVADLMAAARRHYQQGRYAQAEEICHQISAREPLHVHSLNLLGVIAQASGRHKLAVDFFAKAIASDELNAACHYNIASSYQALDQRGEAAVHFKNAIALGLSDKDVEEFITQNPAVAACLERLEKKWPLPIQNEELFGAPGIEAVANDIFLRCAMESIPIRGLALEVFLTHVRSAQLRLANATVPKSHTVDENIIGCSCALAQQCFINEYVFAQSDEETRLAVQLRDLLLERITAGSEVPPLMLAAVAAYFPLHSLAMAESLLERDWPETVAGLLRQQVREPLEETRDHNAIPALTPVEDSVSLQVMRQYEENPYPRWTINPLAVLAGERKMQADTAGSGELRPSQEILIAGCGTGKHAFQIAQYFPDARVLAVDISLASLAYARRKTREEGLRNIAYAQGDILKLGTIGRTFDRIEAVGVLHHLADPKVGWRVLLSLLRPGGEMHVGLYSETARRSIVEARALIAERGYRATAEDIRKFRQEILRNGDDRRWKRLTTSADFYSMSGCRDLLFNVMEHRFTIPEIKTFLHEQGLAFLGFDLEPRVIEMFQQQFPGAAAFTDLDRWQAYEAANPLTFRYMYVFSVRKGLPS
jgi:ubiquinone/menaquinone biosynthesis C-methylase UbiE/tetratricopeptide (TPR) repeat protein